MADFYPSGRLSTFYRAVAEDSRITPIHISLYLALFEQWNRNQCQNPVSISRDRIMKLSKIRGLATYHKYMKELNNMGFISYFPSFHPGLGSEVYLNFIKVDPARNILD